MSGVYLAGSRWAQPAKDWLASVGLGTRDAGFGPFLDVARDLPWVNLDRITLAFSTVVEVDAADLTVRGVIGAYPIASFEYEVRGPFNAQFGVATLTLSRPLGRDRVTIEVNGDAPDGVRDRQFLQLIDGNRDGVSGGDYLRSFAVLPGDVTNDGGVNAIDVAEVKRVLGRSYGDGVTSAGSYYASADVNADGRVNALDVAAVKRNLGTSLPPSSGMTSASLASAITNDLFGSQPIVLG